MENSVCPWDRFQASHINFCEAKLCSWVVKPSETWTNISFVIVGLVVIWLARKENRRDLAPIGVIGIILGVMSGFFHASATYLGAWLDLSAMHLYTGLGIAFNLRRLKSARVWPVFLAVVIPSSAVIYLWEWAGIVLFGLQFAFAYYLESKIKIKKDWRPLIVVLGIFGIALVIWVLDITKLVCNPNNHVLSGHGVWHLLNGLTFYFIYRFYSQFPREKVQTLES